MPMFSGRTSDNVPVVDEIERHEIVLRVKQCVDEGYKRFAVGEGYRILAAYCADVSPKPWIHPDVMGMN